MKVDVGARLFEKIEGSDWLLLNERKVGLCL